MISTACLIKPRLRIIGVNLKKLTHYILGHERALIDSILTIRRCSTNLETIICKPTLPHGLALFGQLGSYAELTPQRGAVKITADRSLQTVLSASWREKLAVLRRLAAPPRPPSPRRHTRRNRRPTGADASPSNRYLSGCASTATPPAALIHPIPDRARATTI